MFYLLENNNVSPWRGTLFRASLTHRLFYHAPLVAILDECTSAVPLDYEDKFYEMLKSKGISIISVGHRPNLIKHHKYLLKVDKSKGWTITPTHSTSEHQLSQLSAESANQEEPAGSPPIPSSSDITSPGITVSAIKKNYQLVKLGLSTRNSVLAFVALLGSVVLWTIIRTYFQQLPAWCIDSLSRKEQWKFMTLLALATGAGIVMVGRKSSA